MLLSRILVGHRPLLRQFSPHLILRSYASLTDLPFTPSPEQLAVVKACRTHNVMVSARPGAGKTATAKAIVAMDPLIPAVIVTYSKRLQMDTLAALEPYGFADVFTFHGLASKLFGKSVYNDNILSQLRHENAQPVWNNAPYELIILDELQDMTDNLYWLAYMFANNIARRQARVPRLLVLGDPRQAIYEFRGADSRFLELAEHTFKDINPYPWKNLKLSRSFRLSHQTTHFVNGFIGEKYIKGSHDGPKPIYMHIDLKNRGAILDAIRPLIEQYTPERSAILAPSIQTNRFLPTITNELTEKYGIPIAVPNSDETRLDDDVLRGKLTAATYHQFKGLERDLVIVYGVDSSYFRFMGRDLPDDRCPNDVFVALTRAGKQLVILHQSNHPAMPFMSWEKMKSTCKYIDLANQVPHPQYPPGRPLQTGLLLPLSVGISEMSRHVQDEVLTNLVKSHLKIREVASALPEGACINLPDKVLTDEGRRYYEAVCDLSGLAVTAAFEWTVTGKCTTFGYKGTTGDPVVPEDPPSKARWFAREATKYEAIVSRYRSRLVQMGSHAFDWLDNDLDKAIEKLRKELPHPSDLKFEVQLSTPLSMQDEGGSGEPQKTKLIGRADIVHYHPNVEQTTIWEIKFVNELSFAHVIQVVGYGLLWARRMANRRRKPVFPRIVLFNVRDRAKWEIETTYEQALALIKGVLRAKYTKEGGIPVSTFLERCNKTRLDLMAADSGTKGAKGAKKSRRGGRRRKPSSKP